MKKQLVCVICDCDILINYDYELKPRTLNKVSYYCMRDVIITDVTDVNTV